MRLKSIRGRLVTDVQIGEKVFLPVSNGEEKKKATDEEKRNVGMDSLAAATTTDGVIYLKSGCKRNLEDAALTLSQAR